MLVHLSLFVLFQGVEMSGTCVGTPQVCLCCFRELRRQARVLVHLSLFVHRCFSELGRQARVLVHLNLFVLFQGVETSGTCVGTLQSV